MNPDGLLQHVEGSRALHRTPVRLPSRVERVVIVGASCTGKTTMGRAVREAAQAAGSPIAVLQRFTTRPPRCNDCSDENRHVSEPEFEALLAAGAIGVQWRRPLDGGREVRYGFEPAPPGAFALYSANNALLESAPALLRDALIVAVSAPLEVRTERLQRRSPDLLRERPAEAEFRLAERSTPATARAHVVVENHGAGEAAAPAEVAALVLLAAAPRSPAVRR